MLTDNVTWISTDDLEEDERLQMAFGDDVVANKDGLENEKTEEIEKHGEPDAEGQEKRLMLLQGFWTL